MIRTRGVKASHAAARPRLVAQRPRAGNYASVFLYDLALGAPIPAPASLGLLLVSALAYARRRRP